MTLYCIKYTVKQILSALCMLLDMWHEPSNICFSLQNAVTLYISVLLINRFRSQRKIQYFIWIWIIWSAFIWAFTAYKRSITLSPALLVRHYDGSSILRALSSDPLFLTVFSVHFNLKHPFLTWHTYSSEKQNVAWDELISCVPQTSSSAERDTTQRSSSRLLFSVPPSIFPPLRRQVDCLTFQVCHGENTTDTSSWFN